jgi:tRNA pseudouridine55 synthase
VSVINLYKPMGQSPLQAMLEHKNKNPNLIDSVMVYAGRLDPMAEGVMLVLTDEDRFDKDEYLHLNKTYEATILFGYTSDTFDALGLAKKESDVDASKIEEQVLNLKQTHNLPFPNYSSYKVQGKPLHWWTKQNRLDEIEIPLKEMKVFNTNKIESKTINSKQALNQITNRIQLVDGDFRQDEIIASWKELLVEDQQLTIASFTIEVSSGTYIRSLANLLGKNLGCGALLLNLKRTKVGKFDILDSVQV